MILCNRHAAWQIAMAIDEWNKRNATPVPVWSQVDKIFSHDCAAFNVGEMHLWIKSQKENLRRYIQRCCIVLHYKLSGRLTRFEQVSKFFLWLRQTYFFSILMKITFLSENFLTSTSKSFWTEIFDIIYIYLSFSSSLPFYSNKLLHYE